MSIQGGSTPNVLLGLLSLGPMSGYDMRHLIEESIGHFWRESFGQIYPSLKRLTAAGLIEKKVEKKKGGPDRHLYSLTGPGREYLREWLKLPVAAEVPRNELLLKLFFGVQAGPAVSRAQVMAHAEFHERALKVYAATVKHLKVHEASDPSLPYWLMTLSYGRHHSSAVLKWCRETVKELDALESKAKRRK